MADNCIADTTSIDLSLLVGSLGGDLQLSEQAGNGLKVAPDGLYLDSPRYDAVRRVATAGVVLGASLNLTLLSLNNNVVADPPTLISTPARTLIQRTGIYLVTGEVAFNTIATGNYRACGVSVFVQGREQVYWDVVYRQLSTGFSTHDQQCNYSGLHYLEKGNLLALYAATDAANAASATVLIEDGGVVLTAGCIVDLS
jgi:putative lipoic acid-binding regulatory protein